MRVVLRADAGLAQGTGHVMRCLTLAEELAERGHQPAMAVTVTGIPWLADAVAVAGFPVLDIPPDLLPRDLLLAGNPDWVVLDSYRFDAAGMRAVSAAAATLAIVDGDRPPAGALLYLDQTLGATDAPAPDGGRILAGAPYALVRRAVRAQRRDEPWIGSTRIVAFTGGSDPHGAIVEVARRLAGLGDAQLTVVAADAHRDAVRAVIADVPGAEVVPPSPALAELLGGADIVVSAGGTSVAELATLGIPSVVIATVGNQSAGLRRLDEDGLALVVDVAGGAGYDEVGTAVHRLRDDAALRRKLSETMQAHYDGCGAERVVAAMAATPARSAQA